MRLLIVFASSISLVATLAWYLMGGKFSMKTQKIDKIVAYFPFVFGDQLDPRNIFTVGEQVLSEHVFGYNAKTSLRGGFEGILSDFDFTSEAQLKLKMKYLVRHPDGTPISFKSYCDGIKESLGGTRHAPYATILNNIDCQDNNNTLVASFKKMPVNLRFLFTLPDFCVAESSKLPMNSINSFSTATGPYYAKEMTIEGAVLKINPNYPNSLRANNVENVELKKYSAGETIQFINQMNPKTHDAAYFFGYSLNPENITDLRNRGYKVEQYPMEWIVYLIVGQKLDLKTKQSIRNIIDVYRKDKLTSESLGTPAYSVAPADRSFALNETEYLKLFPPSKIETIHSHLKLATLETWVEIPFFKKIIEHLKIQIPNLEIVKLPPKEISKLFNGEYDIVLSPLGISHADPLSHISFLESTLSGFDKVVSKELISEIAVKSNSSDFDTAIKSIEAKIVESGLILPIAHFPGVVAYRNDFIRNDDLSFGWGIQTWAFQVD